MALPERESPIPSTQLTPVQGDLMLSSGLCEYYTHTHTLPRMKEKNEKEGTHGDA